MIYRQTKNLANGFLHVSLSVILWKQLCSMHHSNRKAGFTCTSVLMVISFVEHCFSCFKPYLTLFLHFVRLSVLCYIFTSSYFLLLLFPPMTSHIINVLLTVFLYHFSFSTLNFIIYHKDLEIFARKFTIKCKAVNIHTNLF